MGGGGVGGDAGEQVGPVGAAQRGADLVCWPAVGGLAAGGQKQHLITDVQMGQAVGPPSVGQPAQHGHHLAIQRRIQPGGRLIEDEQRRPGQQFHCHRRAFALPAGQPINASVGMTGQLQLLQHPIHRGGALLGAGLRQPQLRGESQGRP